MMACAEFSRLGYYVFNHTGVNSPFDIAIYKNGKFKRVEVKSGKRSRETNSLHYSDPSGEEYDIVCVVDITSGEITIIEKQQI